MIIGRIWAYAIGPSTDRPSPVPTTIQRLNSFNNLQFLANLYKCGDGLVEVVLFVGG
jgi:hypothetical protein